MTEKRFHPFAVLHLLRKTILVYLLPLVQVLFARNWAALWAALAQDVLLLALLSMVCWAVLRVSGWQMDTHGNLLVRWRLGIRLDRTLRADMLAALTIDRPVVYRLAGASRLTLYPAGQKKPLTLIVARDDARELAAAAFDLPYGGLTKPGPAYDKMLEAMQEVIDLSVLEGVNLPADNHKAFLESMAPTFKPDGMPSMRQDVLAQRPTEVEEFAGVVRRLAKKHGMPTPANDFFYEKIREIEAGYHKE